MFTPRNLGKLNPRHRLRKASLILHEVEAGIRGHDREASRRAADYGRSIAAFLAADPDSPGRVVMLARAYIEASGFPASSGEAVEEGEIRALNALRHHLLRESGQSPADWDLVDPSTGKPGPGLGTTYPGMRVFLEDIRSPFNVGSMLRSAEAFGMDEVLLSPDTADPGHPRAARSAMGAAALVSWRRASLDELEGLAKLDGGGSIFALELGGTPLGEFPFPDRGIVILGSEELGVSAEALGRCDLGKVSIPMVGAKGSLNVGVAFGILLSAWSASLAKKRRSY